MERLSDLRQAIEHLLDQQSQAEAIRKDHDKLRIEHAQLLATNEKLSNERAADKDQLQFLSDQLSFLATAKSQLEKENGLLGEKIEQLTQSLQALQATIDHSNIFQSEETATAKPLLNPKSNFILAGYDWTEKALATDGSSWYRTDTEMVDIFNSVCGLCTRQGFYFHQMNRQSDLDRLFDFYGSDKGSNSITGIFPYGHLPHTYGELYEFIFSPIQCQDINIFECGIGSASEDVASNMGSQYKPGASLKAWRDFFPKASVFGIDIDPKCLVNDDRITTCVADQLSHQSIVNALQHFGNQHFDIVIDDGLHTAPACIALFQVLRSYLKPNATYVIEDLTPSTLSEVAQFLKKENINYTIFAGARKYFFQADNDEVRLDDNLLIVIRFMG
jgi:hypothetical protein